jgi:hypothetical protein
MSAGAGHRFGSLRAQRKERIPQLNNAFWLSHRAFGSSARMVYGDIYSVPDEIGTVDL